MAEGAGRRTLAVVPGPGRYTTEAVTLARHVLQSPPERTRELWSDLGRLGRVDVELLAAQGEHHEPCTCCSPCYAWCIPRGLNTAMLRGGQKALQAKLVMLDFLVRDCLEVLRDVVEGDNSGRWVPWREMGLTTNEQVEVMLRFSLNTRLSMRVAQAAHAELRALLYEFDQTAGQLEALAS